MSEPCGSLQPCEEGCGMDCSTGSAIRDGMAPRKTRSGEGKAHRFGGDWTNAKLDVLAKYLSAYTKALKNQPFTKGYIDAFAGTGYRTMCEDEDESSQELLFPEPQAGEREALLEGSATLALKTKPRFDGYVFIERSSARCAQLEALKEEFPDLAPDIQIREGEANAEIQKLCALPWQRRRAVLFLDPYGMQVEWTTIEAVARTHAIDTWLLFPLGVAVTRLLTKSGKIPDAWRRSLDRLLGTTDWYDEFYRVEKTFTLFGQEERVVRATADSIGRYFNKRLKTVFADVADQPGVLRNSANVPLYLLCFAVGNARGATPALRIAKSLLKGVQ